MAQSGLSDKAYNELNAFFTDHAGVVVEIEILPPALAPTDSLTLQDKLNLGVSKKVLVQAYLKARELFFTAKSDLDQENACFEATRIMILFDPEQLTAVNFRKQRIERILAVCTQGQWDPIAVALQHEVFFLDSILTSPLHRQTKSPTLWYHRTCIISMLRLQRDLKEGFKFDGSIFQTELRSVFKASERHPKNYYAWQHARRMLTGIEKKYRLENAKEDPSWQDLHLQHLYQSCTLYTKDWCVMNPSDTSGWSFLAFMLRLLSDRDAKTDLVAQVLSRTLRLRWHYESVWAFFRAGLGDAEIVDYRHDGLIAKVQDDDDDDDDIKIGNEDSQKGQISVKKISTETPRAKAIKWIHQYSTHSSAT